MSTDEESTFLSSLPSSPLALQTNLSKQSTVPGTILGSNHNRNQSPESEHKLSQSQSNNPTSAFPASRKSLPPTMSAQFSEIGMPVAGTPMASISSYNERHQQMHLPGALMPLTNGRYQFRVVPLQGMTAKNTYMYPSQHDHRLWFIYYRLDKRADFNEAARKLTRGSHHIISSNGKVIYPQFKIGKNSELVAATRNHTLEVHGPNPKGKTTSCFYMIVEFEEPMSPNLVEFDAGDGKVLPKMYDIIKEEAARDDDTGELVFNMQTEARYHSTLNNSEEDTEEEDDAYDDPRANMRNKNRSHQRTNTFDRADNNHRMVKSSQADKKANIYRHTIRRTRRQDMHSESESEGYVSYSTGDDSTLSPPRDSDRNLGRRRSYHTPPRHERSPAGGHHHLGSRDSHRKGRSTAAYSGRQGSHGQSSGRNHSSSPSVSKSLSRMAVTSAHQSPLRSTSTVSTRNLQTPLTSNVLPNENREYAAAAVDSRDASSHHSNRTDLGPEQQDEWSSSASSNESGVEDGAEDSREEESVPEHIETSVQEAVDVSPGAFTAGASYHTAQSQTTNNNPSIVSDNQPTIRTRRSERASKGHHSFRQRIDM